MDLIQRGDLREGVGEHAAEACHHLVTYMAHMGQVGVELALLRLVESRRKRAKDAACVL